MKITIILFTILTLLTVDSVGQEKTELVGIATDGHRNRLIGINVMIKGTTVGGVTDTCGRFSIPVDSEKFTLLFHGMSYNDMRTFEIDLTKNDITSDTLVFQLGHWKAPNPICDKVGKKRKRKLIE
jgi:carboxypeptidase-like protein